MYDVVECYWFIRLEQFLLHVILGFLEIHSLVLYLLHILIGKNEDGDIGETQEICICLILKQE